MTRASTTFERTRLVMGLGIAQLIAWGTLYYTIAVLAEPMRRALALSETAVYGAFSLSLALAGGLTPWAGRLVDRHGGRVVLAASTVCGAAGLALLAGATGWAHLLLGYGVLGVAMALGLYEVCFAAIAQAMPSHYRPSVTGLTLIAGLASSAFWPLSHHLEAAYDFRTVFTAYAVLLLLCLPLYLLLLPRSEHRIARPHGASSYRDAERHLGCKCARGLAFAFAGATAVGAALSAHLLTALLSVHIDGDRAVWLAGSIGVLQVLGRSAELASTKPISGTRLGTLSLGALAVSIGVLLLADMLPGAVLLFAVLYGASNGVLTIVRAVVPMQLFGHAQPGLVVAGFASPSLVARAFAPLAFAQLSAYAGTYGALVGTCALALVSWGVYVHALRGFAPRCAHGCPPAAVTATRIA
jgi:MFS family permease